jgi:hypothetical protein
MADIKLPILSPPSDHLFPVRVGFGLDPRLVPLDGYDIDICMQARARARRATQMGLGRRPSPHIDSRS